MDSKPAFPGKYTVPEFSFNTALGMQVEPAHDAYNPGMTMRQYYKAAALSGIAANELYFDFSAQSITEYAALYADAMIAEDEEHGKS